MTSVTPRFFSPQLYSLAVTLASIVLFGYVCHIAAGIMIPLVVAVFVWYLINAIARFLLFFGRRYRVKIPSVWRFALAIFMIWSVGFFIYELVHNNIDAVVREAPKFQESLNRIAQQLATILALDHAVTMQDVDAAIGKYINIGDAIRAFAEMMTGIAGKTFMVFLFVGFLLYEQRFFKRKLRAMSDDRDTQNNVRHVLHTIDIKIQKYIGVKAFVSVLDSILTFGILTAFSVDFAGFWGVMAFFLHFIPYAGSFIALTLPTMVALVQFGDLPTALFVLSALSLSHAFLGHVLDPYLMGNNLNLSPIVIITNLAVWGMLWGVPGMFLAIPILAIVTITLSQFDRTRALAVLLSKTGVIETRRRKLLKISVLR